jgi:hypothetical protein
VSRHEPNQRTSQAADPAPGFNPASRARQHGGHTVAASVICLSLAAFLFFTGCAAKPTTTPTLPRLSGAVSDIQAAQKNLQRGDAGGAAKLLPGVITELQQRESSFREIKIQLGRTQDENNSLKRENGKLKTDLDIAKNEVGKLKVDWWFNRISTLFKISVAGLLGIAVGVTGGPWIKKGLGLILKIGLCVVFLFNAETRSQGGERFQINFKSQISNSKQRFSASPRLCGEKFYEGKNQRLVPALSGNNLVRGVAVVVAGAGAGVERPDQ